MEFGEQLKKAREEKGMTQQTLAEHLYVTRQAVSRWERGDRYPDLIMAKKISAFLGVSLDDLLSSDEMKRVAERNPLIEKPLMKRFQVILYACMAFSVLLTAADIMVRFPVSSAMIDYSDMQIIAVNLLGLFIQCIIFVYGLTEALKNALTPKKTGIFLTVYFVSLCLTNSGRIVYSSAGRRIMIVELLLIVPCIFGAAAAYQYFHRAKSEPVWYGLLLIVSGWEAARIILTACDQFRSAAGFGSVNTAWNLFFRMCIYLLIIYQVCIMKRKREQAIADTVK